MKKLAIIFFLANILTLTLLPVSMLMDLPLPEDLPRFYDPERGFLGRFAIYDGLNLLRIAETGYSTEPLYAFFPLYPLLIRALSILLPSEVAALLISLSSSFAVSFLLYRQVKVRNSTVSLLAWLLSPIAVFAMSAYTESLFVFLTLFSWIKFREEKYLLAGVFAGLGMLTRGAGFIFFGVLGLELLFRKVSWKTLLSFSLPGGVLGSLYPLFLFFETGDPFKFSTVQSFWQRTLSLPWRGIILDIDALSSSYLHLPIIINLLSLTLLVSLCLWAGKKYPFLSLYAFISVIIPLTMPVIHPGVPATTSLFRYVFGMFPVYLFIGELPFRKGTLLGLLVPYLTVSMLVSVVFFLKRFIG